MPLRARAFQKAKVAAQEKLIGSLRKPKSGKKLVMVTIVPRGETFTPGELNVDFRKKNRWLRDVLRRAGFDRVMFGSADISWERGGYYQLHWHLAMWTSSPKKLTKRLKKLVPDDKRYARPILVSKTTDLDFLGYINKVIKLPDLLRLNRRHLPELLLMLDRTEPLDLIFLIRLRLSTRKGNLVLKRIKHRKATTDRITPRTITLSVAARR